MILFIQLYQKTYPVCPRASIMSKSKNAENDFIICVREPDPKNKRHLLIHPVLLICNSDPNEYVSPETVINSFKLLNCPQNGKLISILRSQVNEKNWNLLKAGLKDSEIYKTGVKIKDEILCV